MLLVRHGATSRTAENRFSGAVGVDLSEQGRHQARRLEERLAQPRIGAVFSSPLSRALDTAQIVLGQRQLVIEQRDGLQEISHGHWEGLTRSEVEQRYPDEYAAWEADPFTFAPAGGESGVAVLARALPVLRDIVVAYPNDTVLVVSHKATLRLLIASLLGFDARGYRDRLDQAPACLNILEFASPVRARLMLFNDVSHYADQPRRPEANLSSWWDRGR